MAEEGFIPAIFYGGGGGLRRLLRDVEGRYGDAFDDLGPGALQDLKHLIDCIDSFLDLLADPRTGFRVKLMDYGRIRNDVLEFCQFYAKLLGNPLMERLRHEIYELLEEAVSWWGEQDILDIIGS